MRRRELLGFVYSWLGLYPSSLVIKKGVGGEGEGNKTWEARDDGLALLWRVR